MSTSSSLYEMAGDEATGDEIANVVLKAFDAWPSKRKPIERGNGTKEWVPISGIVAECNGYLICLAVATGMKCLPQNKISQAQGVTLHDWHAEILAIRAFNQYLLDECHLLASSRTSSPCLRLRCTDDLVGKEVRPFVLNENVKFHMYCSEAPCGDASMELTMAAQENSTPWEVPPPIATDLPSESSTAVSVTTLLQGRSYFSNLGSIRRKPSRPDAPPTRSKSCSDKLALKQSTSLLSSITSLLIAPSDIYLTSLVLPESQYSQTACKRAFGKTGRLATSNDEKWGGGYHFHPFEIRTTSREFSYSRRQALPPGESLVPSNIASFSIPDTYEATLIGGSLQGRKQFSLKGACLMTKKLMWALALDIAKITKEADTVEVLSMESYLSVKQSYLLDDRRKVKSEIRSVLGGSAGEAAWIRNEGGEDFGLDDLSDVDWKAVYTSHRHA